MRIIFRIRLQDAALRRMKPRDRGTMTAKNEGTKPKIGFTDILHHSIVRVGRARAYQRKNRLSRSMVGDAHMTKIALLQGVQDLSSSAWGRWGVTWLSDESRCNRHLQKLIIRCLKPL